MDKMVSVIIPVYNGENSINECIQSVCAQTYKNLQIIIINDGSSDNTAKICDKLASMDSRITVLHLENGGVSRARNIGLSHAKGEYIQFVDGDDTLKINATEEYVKSIGCEDIDLVVSGYIKLLPEINIANNKMEDSGIYTNRDYLINTLKDPGHHYYGVVWNKLYKREIIEKNNIRFIEKACLGEDFIFNMHYIVHTVEVKVIKDRLYLYNCKKNNSLSRYDKNLTSSINELMNRHIIFDNYKRAFKSLSIYEEYKDRVQQYWLIYLAMNIYYIKIEFKYWDNRELREWEKILLEDEEIIKCKKTIPKIKLKTLVCKITLNRLFAKETKKLIGIVRKKGVSNG